MYLQIAIYSSYSSVSVTLQCTCTLLICDIFFFSKLVQEGLSQHEISERVKEKAMNESESIYGTLYGTLEETDTMLVHCNDPCSLCCVKCDMIRVWPVCSL